ncbi:glucose 1-dehydrogenase [Pseudomonas sp. YuFO20]|uniref:SDR family NAD(P)-dependent oxidoreductase n=1 Tax=Pseudomonas neuropathica TaxID=2730425 RepID=A0ACC7MRT1_9PSED|nr:MULTISPECIES: glucose 1-dehydrogenase [unclassified Pseudomonas]MEB2514457.1 glucose 1-dehydrogenase [Pseudomonas sp. YuFO20]MEB2621331.1 glucose 1-dehydrogenase [Pseudomonas sp. YuFO8]
MNTVFERFALAGKVALVTGAAQGLGAETAHTLAMAGAKVMVSDLQLEQAQATAERIRAAGGEALAMVHDVTDEAQWQQVVAATVEAFGGLDVLVNNAGIEKMALFTEACVEDFRLMHEINVTGVFLGIKHAARVMRPGAAAGKGGSIINLSSVAGLVGMPALGGYCSSKGAVRLMSKAAAVEFARLGYGVRVNSIHPAIIKTDMGVNVVRGFVAIGLAPDEASADAYAESLHPLGYGQPQDVSSAVLFLASEASRWSTGSEIVIDGGACAC